MRPRKWFVLFLAAVIAGIAAGAPAESMDWPWHVGTTPGDPYNEPDALGSLVLQRRADNKGTFIVLY